MKKLILIIALCSLYCCSNDTDTENLIQEPLKTESFFKETDSLKIYVYPNYYSKKKEWHSFNFVKSSRKLIFGKISNGVKIYEEIKIDENVINNFYFSNPNIPNSIMTNDKGTVRFTIENTFIFESINNENNFIIKNSQYF